jgi:hypothetical protein
MTLKRMFVGPLLCLGLMGALGLTACSDDESKGGGTAKLES